MEIDNKMTEIHCGHRVFYVAGGDTITSRYDEKIAMSKEYVIDHTCEELTVYRKRFGLKRIYYQKFNNTIDESTEDIEIDIEDREEI